MNDNLEKDWHDDNFILGNLLDNMRWSNPKSINRVRKLDNRELLSEKEYMEQEKIYKKTTEAYKIKEKQMVNKYGDLDEAFKKYRILEYENKFDF